MTDFKIAELGTTDGRTLVKDPQVSDFQHQSNSIDDLIAKLQEMKETSDGLWEVEWYTGKSAKAENSFLSATVVDKERFFGRDGTPAGFVVKEG